MQKLTPREEEVFDTIKDFIQENGYPPTNNEIGDELDIHEATVRHHVGNLQKKGWLEREKDKPRTIKLV